MILLETIMEIFHLCSRKESFLLYHPLHILYIIIAILARNTRKKIHKLNII